MKKLSVIMLILILTGSLAACGCQNSNPATDPSDNVTRQTEPSNMIIPDPTIDTNIPDSSVDPSTHEDPSDMNSGMDTGMDSRIFRK